MHEVGHERQRRRLDVVDEVQLYDGHGVARAAGWRRTTFPELPRQFEAARGCRGGLREGFPLDRASAIEFQRSPLRCRKVVLPPARPAWWGAVLLAELPDACHSPCLTSMSPASMSFLTEGCSSSWSRIWPDFPGPR